MYCRKCGKYIDGDTVLCPECAAEEAAKQAYIETFRNSTNPQPSVKSSGSDKMFGFGKALTAVILAYFAMILLEVAYGVCAGMFMSSTDEAMVLAGRITLALFTLIGLGLCIPSLVMGINSIKISKARQEAGYAKPIVTFILGIVGTVLSAIDCLLVFINFIAIVAL